MAKKDTQQKSPWTGEETSSGYDISYNGVISNSFQIFSKSAGSLLGLVFLPMAPILLLIPLIFGAAALEMSSDAATVAVIGLVFVALLIIMGLSFWVEAAISVSLIKAVPSGGQIHFKQALRDARGQIFRVFAASFVSGLVIVLGFFALIVPGVFFAIWFGLTVPAAVDKKLGPIEAMKESKRIVSGNENLMFLLLLTFIVAMTVVSVIPILSFVGGPIFEILLAAGAVYLYFGLKDKSQ